MKMNANISDGQGFLAGGRWATERLLAVAKEGKALTAAALRTLDTLRHEEWEQFDQALVEEAQIRLIGVADLMGRGLTRPVTNALGKTVFAYEKSTTMDAASVSLDGLAQTANDKIEFQLNQLPLPVIHKDFFLNLRTLAASRNSGEPLDTTSARAAGRVVLEAAESLLFNGGATFGGLPIYGYTTHPDRNNTTFDGGKDWGDTSKAGTSYLTDVKTALATLAGDRYFGPYTVYVPADAGIALEGDYNAGTANIQTIRQRLMAVDQISDIRVADQLATGNVVFVQMVPDVIVWVNGENLQTIQWDSMGGFVVNFKAFMIGVPLVRSDITGRSGIFHFHD